jgi:hypothetical protein
MDFRSVDAGSRGGDAVVAQFELRVSAQSGLRAVASKIVYEGWNTFEIHG